MTFQKLKVMKKIKIDQEKRDEVGKRKEFRSYKGL